jgi:hypothetical protein
MLYESEPSIARHRGQSGRMVNGKSPISLKNLDLGWHCAMLSRPAGVAYSSLAREIVIAASVLVRVHSMSRRR